MTALLLPILWGLNGDWLVTAYETTLLLEIASIATVTPRLLYLLRSRTCASQQHSDYI